MKDIVFVATAGIASNTATKFTATPVRRIVSAYKISGKLATIVGSATGSDQSAFVPLKDGAGTTLAATAIGKSNLSSDVDLTQYVVALTVVNTTPAQAGQIQLSSPTEFKCYDALIAGDRIVLKVVEKGEYPGA